MSTSAKEPRESFDKRLQALCALSNISSPIDMGHFMNQISEAPDPETALRRVLDDMPDTSAALSRQWRSVVFDVWAKQHPRVPLLPQLQLSSSDVQDAPLVTDARALLAELHRQPARLIQEHQEWLVHPDDVMRLQRSLPSNASKPQLPVEHEWAALEVRRLRAVLLAARLIRPIKGTLVPVRSRVTRFNNLPAAQQLYVLWHNDVYHIDWLEFGGLWGKFMQTVQEYAPLLWEASGTPQADQQELRTEWALSVFEAFASFWEEEGLLDVRPGHTAALHIVQQHALPTIIDRFLLRGLFERHGLITITEEFGSISKFTWTRVGEALLTAETRHELPCGNDLLQQ